MTNNYNNIEQDGQACGQEIITNFDGPTTIESTEKYLYSDKQFDGKTIRATQVLDKDISQWKLINDDSYVTENNICMEIINNGFL